ncbi:MAG: acetate--CoA ligase family protein [bacterium]|nr:acetate--CoA ligase family protein [bacterium]
MMETGADLSGRAGDTRSLSEFESRKILVSYGIPVVATTLVTTQQEAVDAATGTGYPVVLKGCGAGLTHKSEAGVVKLNLNTGAEVASAFTAIETAAAGALDGILVQPQIKGTRELVAGMIRDPQFGPCVMFGLGGIFTEVLDDACFRIAPLEERDALAMMDSTRGSAILGPVRGTAPADRSALSRVLISLGRIGLEHDQVEAIDVNPLLLQENGAPVAVDAAIWLTL